MKLIITLDTQNGMLFNGRRQSRDRILNERLLEIVGDSRLAVSPYTKKMLEEAENAIACDSPLEACNGADFCFAEFKIESLEEVDSLYIFLWNRHYPADTFFELDPESEGFLLAEALEFQGSSHEKITLLRYERS